MVRILVAAATLLACVMGGPRISLGVDDRRIQDLERQVTEPLQLRVGHGRAGRLEEVHHRGPGVRRRPLDGDSRAAGCRRLRLCLLRRGHGPDRGGEQGGEQGASSRDASHAAYYARVASPSDRGSGRTRACNGNPAVFTWTRRHGGLQ